MCAYWVLIDDLFYRKQSNNVVKWGNSELQLPSTLLWHHLSSSPHSWATSKAIRWEEEPSRLRLYTSLLTEHCLAGSQDAATLLHPSLSASQQNLHHRPRVCRRHRHRCWHHLASPLKRHCCIITSADNGGCGEDLCQTAWVSLLARTLGTVCGFNACC